MSLRGFFRSLFSGRRSGDASFRHSGHDLADHVRETIGPLGGGGEGGRVTGHAVYELLEDDPAEPRPPELSN